jgi:hypothetical protein
LLIAEQIGLTPEEVVAKIMANPEVAVAFQDPKVQAAIMDVSGHHISLSIWSFGDLGIHPARKLYK